MSTEFITYDAEADALSVPLPGVAGSRATLVLPVDLVLKSIEEGGGGTVNRSRTYGIRPAWFARMAVLSFALGVGLMFLGWPPGAWSFWRMALWVVGLTVAGDLGWLCIADFRYARRMARKGAR